MIIALQTLIYFRETLLNVLNRVFWPYYKRFSVAFNNNGEESDEEEPDDQVFSEYDDEKGVIFYPPMYSQRYAAVSDCLMDERWRGKLEKVVDFGYHDMSFIKYLKEVPGIQCILGVDIESIPLRCTSDLFSVEDYAPRRETPLQVTLFQGNAADPDYRLIGCDAVIAIEMIEHMLPHDLERLVHNVFGFIKPWVVIFTTPNGDFNVLFKSLEKNGYRRLDHFFEWSREQFHDWCSNIIARYPLYSVTCQGIGPGPPGTLHYGCCSQLAMFVNKNYHKQQDLNFNSLALVPMPVLQTTNDLIDSWEPGEFNNSLQADLEPINAPNSIESLTEFLAKANQSSVTLMYSPTLTPSMSFMPSNSDEHFTTSSDKVSQCDLDSEYGKSFLMFDEEEFLNIRVPRKREHSMVYEMEDVTCRLNCSTLQVKKFSKITQNLMAKNKIDYLVHTREVVDEIRHLTKTLKFNKCIMDKPEEPSNIWYNINWGDNAPYWNQYYKVVKEYCYPFETKSDECRILDLISEEINRMLDTQFDEDILCDVNRLEIPLSHLMSVVDHITTDIDAVRDLLVWNGYEIVDDVLIHSRMVVCTTVSVGTHDEESPDNMSAFSDWDNITEVRSSTVLSDGSTTVPDYQDRCLRRALDHKLRNLRTMLRADEDITTELDKVVCKLMKLALRSSKRRTSPPPAKWMQCKLLDLLTLTEKAIQRRQKNFIKTTFKALEFEKQEVFDGRHDLIARHIENSYRHIISPTDLKNSDGITPNVTSTTLFDTDVLVSEEINPIERTKAWLNVDVEVVPFHNNDLNYENNSSGNTDSRTSVGHKQKKVRHRNTANDEIDATICMTSSSKTSVNKYKLKREERKKKTSNTRVSKKVSRTVARNSGKKTSASNDKCIVRPKRKIKENRCQTMRASKPIPESLIDLCHPELKGGQHIKEFNTLNDVDESKNIVILNQPCPIVTAEESLLLDIIMDDIHETTALSKNIGTDVEVEIVDICDTSQANTTSNNFDLNLRTRHEVSTEEISSQTIFLNDINEPSTSKGIRHNVGMDVQCGPDLAAYPMLSASTSLLKLAPVCATGIKICDGANGALRGTDCSTSMQDNDFDNIISPRWRSIGIKIKDSDVNICPSIEMSTMNHEPRKRSCDSRCWSVGRRSWSPESNIVVDSDKRGLLSSTPADTLIETELETISSNSNIKYPCSKLYANNLGSPSIEYSSKTASDVLLMDIKDRKLVECGLNMQNSKPKLSCGGLHVHSYKSKQESEDIVFQGKWERCSPKPARKKAHNTVVAKKITDTGNRRQKDNTKEKRVISKHEISIKRPEKKDIKPEHRQPRQLRNIRLQKTKQETTNENTIKRPIQNFSKVVPNVTKVASKIAMSAIVSKNVKSTFTAKKPKFIATVTVAKEDNAPKLPKCYLPKYIPKKRKTETSDKSNLNKSIDSVKDDLKEKKETITKNVVHLVRSKTDEIKKDLLQFQGNIAENTYLVLYNEKQGNSASIHGKKITNSSSNEDSTMPNNSLIRHANSHQSLNSSTCSSPNSIATVRAVPAKSKKISYIRHSGSSNRSSVNTSESDNPTPSKMKKVTKRFRAAKITDSNKDTHNKENIPETTENCATKETEKNAKSPFLGKSVCIAQLKTDRSSIQTSMSKHKTLNKTNIKIPMLQDTIEKKPPLSASASARKPLKLATSSVRNMDISKNITDSDSSECADMVLVLDQQERILKPKTVICTEGVKTADNCLFNEWIQNLHVQPNTTTNEIRRLVEELLDFIDKPVITSSDDDRSYRVDSIDSFCSFKTVTLPENDKEISLNHPLDTSDTRLTMADFDLLSFKSMTSVSKDSEYFLADSELNAAIVEHLPESSVAHNPTPVTDIFERKEHLVQKPPGVFANQAFSGFSLDGEPVTCQQPDPISLIDSETGSVAAGQAAMRHATSEEVFISGRSSVSFQSRQVVEDDSVVPNWLFNLISQQHSQVVEEHPMIGPQPAPIATVDSEYDFNGNAIEPGIIGLAAGAGDGRGIHSDQSQESSGRGTSLSSSDTSSSPQSEALLTDLSAYTTQFELLRDATASSVLSAAEFNENGSLEENPRRAEESDNILPGRIHHLPRTRLNRGSDISADISSIDTDVIDSSDD